MSRFGKFASVTVAIAAGALGLAACGDDDGSSGGSERDPDPRDDRPAGLLRPGRRVRPAVLRRHLQRLPEPAAGPAGRQQGRAGGRRVLRLHRRRRHGLRVHAQGRAQVLRRLGPDLRGRQVFSFDRNLEDRRPAGRLVAAREHEEHRDAGRRRRSIFNLKAPDATWPFAADHRRRSAIVPSDVYPADKLQPRDEVIGSGRYTVAEYEPGQQTVLEANDEYTGDDPAQIDRVIIQYFDKASTLKLAVEQGEVDIAYRCLSPTDIDDLEGADGVNVVEGDGARDPLPRLQPRPAGGQRRAEAGDPPGGRADDRPRSRSPTTSTTAPSTPLYSMVPPGLQFPPRRSPTSTARRPTDAATQTLEDAGVDTPVPLEVWWTPSHYGPSSGDEYAEIKRQLDEQRPVRRDAEVDRVEPVLGGGVHRQVPAVYQLGWFPDYPDADNYTRSFYSKDSFLNIHYDNPEMEKLLAEEKASTDDADARGGVRADPADRRRGRADDPDTWQAQPGRGGRRTASRASRTPSTRRSSSATG